MQHIHPQPPDSPPTTRRTRWLLACALLLGGCILPHQRLQRHEHCPQLPTSQLTGWIEQLTSHCAMLTNPGGKMRYISRRNLPKGTREGDYLRAGRYQRETTQAARQESQALIHARRPLPRVFLIPGTRTPPSRTRASNTNSNSPPEPYRRGMWKHFSTTRKTARKQRKIQRFERREWRR